MKPTITEVRMRMPDRELLERAAPFELWEEACKQALRSPHKRHRTGCIIYNRYGEILSKGVAHTHGGGLAVRSIHAERDALSSLSHNRYWDNCIVVTLTKVGNFAEISKPCMDCAQALAVRAISNVIFCEKANDETWSVIKAHPNSLHNLKPTRYAYQSSELQAQCS